MRYFLLAFFLACLLVWGILGTRGRISRRPPIEIFSDMDRQPKLRPQHLNEFFADGRSSRLPVEGTVARGEHALDVPVNTGMLTGMTNFVATNPLKITDAVMLRGRQRFEIYCSPCHGLQGDGNGVVKNFGMATTRSLHEARIVQMPDGEIFNVITHGRNTMGPYGPQVLVEDRWAIVAYVRALQLAQLGQPDDLPPDQRVAVAK